MVRLKIESEKLLDKKLVALVESNGGWCIKLSSIHVSGLPDRLCVFPNGKVIFVEVKTTGKKPSKIQLSVHERLQSMGFTVFVVDSSNGLKNIMLNA